MTQSLRMQVQRAKKSSMVVVGVSNILYERQRQQEFRLNLRQNILRHFARTAEADFLILDH